jgi:metallothiol transferase
VSIKGLNHFLFSVSDLDNSIEFYKNVFDAKLLVKGRSTAYFDLNGMWLALNVEKDIPRNEINQSYTHIAFSIENTEFDKMYDRLKELNINILSGRPRDVRKKNLFTLLTQTVINLSSIQVLYKIDWITISKKKHIWSFSIKRISY